MKNLSLLRDGIHADLFADESCIVSVCRDVGSTQLFLLSANGKLLSIDCDSCSLVSQESWDLNSCSESASNEWFLVSAVAETGSIVCLSQSGTIVSIKEDLVTGRRSESVEVEGDIDGGIAAAAWSPDSTCLAIITNNNSLLLMTGYWDVLEEIPLLGGGRIPGSACSLSWRGDGEFFTLVTVDAEDGITRARVYTKTLELHSTGRNVADGPGSLLRGLDPIVSYATNGSLIALVQQKSKLKRQIAFIEKNGLRHGEFELQYPEMPSWSLSTPAAGNNSSELSGSAGASEYEWVVSSLHWDLPSTLLAVGLKLQQKTDVSSTGAGTATGTGTDSSYWGAVQVYYRTNYKWHLKQQWTAPSLRCLGFDSESVGRLFMSQSATASVSTGTSSVAASASALRVVDLVWDVCASSTGDGSVAVVDGANLLMTPLAYNTVPPPMSMYKQALPSPCRDAFFWPRESHNSGLSAGSADSDLWGLACLCDGDKVRVIFGDQRGNPRRFVDVTVPSSRSSAGPVVFRGISACECEDNSSVITVILHGSRVRRLSASSDVDGSSLSDKLLTLKVNTTDGSVLNAVLCTLGSDSADQAIISTDQENTGHASADVHMITKMGLWPGRPSCIAVGIRRSDLSHSWDADILEVICAHSLSSGILSVDVSQTVTIPETCTHIAVLPGSAGADVKTQTETETHTETEGEHRIVVGLSARGKLYCGEVLLIAGVSTFAVNAPLEMLMFVTTGTRPHLHFVSFSSLRELDPLSGEVWDERLYGVSGTVNEPRPVERGARLVTAISGSTKVVLQMPRGNLEAFEPRPLVLMKARSMIDSGEMLKVLLLLRRQRVDLNYIIDYHPVKFLSCVNQLVEDALNSNPEVLSLLVTALEPFDVTFDKYPPDVFVDFKQRVSELPQPDFFDGSNKVNIVCAAIREALIAHLRPGGGNSSGSSSEGAYNAHALNPALCTFAKQQPPLLVDALELIRDVVAGAGKASSGNSSGLSSSKVQAAIKYLAFLADGEQLFHAALGDCLFDLARAVARQCQMDPKVYLPLIRGFEDLGAGYSAESWQHVYMRFSVAAHLKRTEAVVDRCAELISSLAAVEQASLTSDSVDKLKTAVNSSFELVSANEAFAYALPKLSRASMSLSSNVSADILNLSKGFMNKLRRSFGALCVKKKEYKEAVVAYLSVDPPCAADAVDVARLDGDWQQALLIAGRFQGMQITSSSGETATFDVDPRRIANEIVSEFRAGLEQGECGLFGDEPDDDEGQPVGMGAGTDGGAANLSADKAIEAAQLSLEYCHDAETAVAILILAKKWTSAAHSALKSNRRDLLNDEIAPAARSEAKALLSALPKRASRLAALVTDLKSIWADTKDRLCKVSSTEPSLVYELRGVRNREEDGVEDGYADDTRSEFTATSNASMLSGATERSSQSRRSSRSNRSSASRRSTTSSSASSSVSVLSQMSVGSSASTAKKSDTSFSIQGLDHTLLSRGDACGPGGSDMYNGKKEPDRKQRRRQRKQAKGEGGRDLWGLRKESAACRELLNMANIAALARSVRDLSDLLLLLSGKGDLELAVGLQKAVDEFIVKLQGNAAPVAPLYPPKWLDKRQMSHVARFQEYLADTNTDNANDLNAPTSTAPATATAVLTQDAGDEDQEQDEGGAHVTGNPQGTGAPSSAISNEEILSLAGRVQAAIVQARRGAPADTWWKRATDGIRLWQSLRRVNLE